MLSQELLVLLLQLLQLLAVSPTASTAPTAFTASPATIATVSTVSTAAQLLNLLLLFAHLLVVGCGLRLEPIDLGLQIAVQALGIGNLSFQDGPQIFPLVPLVGQFLARPSRSATAKPRDSPSR